MYLPAEQVKTRRQQPLLPIQATGMATGPISIPLKNKILYMPVKKNTTQPAKTKTAVNKTAALHAVDANTTTPVKKSQGAGKSKPPVVKDIDESSPDRK
jgi:hypothetical protein